MGRVPRALNVVTLILLCATCSAKAAPDVQLPSGIARGKASDFAPSQNIIIPRGQYKIFLKKSVLTNTELLTTPYAERDVTGKTIWKLGLHLGLYSQSENWVYT